MQFIDDVRYAMRQFAHAPGFTATAVLTLALGIGATTAIFTLVHAVLLKSLPVAKPSELIRIGDNENCCVNGGLAGQLVAFLLRQVQNLPRRDARVHRTGRLPGRAQSDGSPAQREQPAGRVAAHPVRFGKLLLDVWHQRIRRANVHPGGRSPGSGAGRGDELRDLATEVRVRIRP